jgi:hypothetical protein
MKVKAITTLLIAGMLIGLGCNPVDPPATDDYREILLLKVDYDAFAFEGGVRYAFPEGGPKLDSIPVVMEYQAPSDIGYLKLRYAPTNSVLFEGSILYDSIGRRLIPESMEGPGTFEMAAGNLDYPPDDITVFWTGPGYANVPLDSAWSAISDLSLVHSFVEKGAQIGLFLYVPTAIGAGAETYDWYFLLYR